MTVANLSSDRISVSLNEYNSSAENNDNTIELNKNALELKIRVKVIGTDDTKNDSDEIIRGSKGIYGAAGLIYLIYDSDSDIPTEKLFSRVTFKQTTILVGSTYEMVYTIYF